MILLPPLSATAAVGLGEKMCDADHTKSAKSVICITKCRFLQVRTEMVPVRLLASLRRKQDIEILDLSGSKREDFYLGGDAMIAGGGQACIFCGRLVTASINCDRPSPDRLSIRTDLA